MLLITKKGCMLWGKCSSELSRNLSRNTPNKEECLAGPRAEIFYLSRFLTETIRGKPLMSSKYNRGKTPRSTRYSLGNIGPNVLLIWLMVVCVGCFFTAGSEIEVNAVQVHTTSCYYLLLLFDITATWMTKPFLKPVCCLFARSSCVHRSSFLLFLSLKQLTVHLRKHSEALAELENGIKSSRKLESLCREFEMQKVCYLPLNTFLLRPLHRLMHYKQIMERLCKYYPPNHVDFRDSRGEWYLRVPVWAAASMLGIQVQVAWNVDQQVHPEWRSGRWAKS